MDSLVEDHDVEAVHTSNPYVEVEDRIDSIRFLLDSEEDRLVNMAAGHDPSMVLHQGQEVADDRHSSMHLSMKLVLQVGTVVLRHDTMHRHGYRNFLFQLELASQLEREAQSRSRNASQVYCDVGYRKDHHSSAQNH